jgi:hypothetical protein
MALRALRLKTLTVKSLPAMETAAPRLQFRSLEGGMQMNLRNSILSLLAAALVFTLAAPAQALCHCRYRHYRTGYYRSAVPGSAWVKTDVEPDEARVYLDGRFVGTADDYDGFPRMLRVSAGTHRLTFRLRGHVPYTVVVRAWPGRVIDIDHWLRS